MKKIIVLLITLIILSFSLVNADDKNIWAVNNVSSKYISKDIYYIISPEFSWLEQFYKENLSIDEINEIKLIYSNFNTESKEIFFKTTCNSVNDMNNLVKKLYISLEKYISNEKQDLYYEYMINNSEIETKWICQTKPFIIFEKYYKENRIKFLSENKIKEIKAKLNDFTEEKFDLIIDKINQLRNWLLTNYIKNERKILLFEELTEVINNYRDTKSIDDLIK